MNPTHQTILDAVIRKAEQICPEALDLIGIYGSCATGDTYEKSDLDLMILINDPKGYSLCECFVLEDADVGYDLYCTTWESLENDASCGHAQLSKLLDAKVVYGKKEAFTRLEALREKARAVLASSQRVELAKAAYDRAKGSYADCFLAEDPAAVRLNAGMVIYNLLGAVMLHNGQYFHRGVKRTFEEIGTLKLPFDMEGLTLAVIRCKTVEEIRGALTTLMHSVRDYLEKPDQKALPCRENLTGTYEEMHSNWRNKVWEAAENGDLFSAYMNMGSCQLMLREIASTVAVPEMDLMGSFDPEDLNANGEAFDDMLSQFADIYRKAGFAPKIYESVEAFRKDYIGK